MTLIWVFAIFNTSIAGVTLLRPVRSPNRRRRPAHPVVNFRRVGIVFITTLLTLFLELPFLYLCRVNFFGLINLAYLSLFVMLPTLGLSTLVAAVVGRRPNPGPYVTKNVCLLATAFLLLIPIGVYASFFEPYHLRTETTNLSAPPCRIGRDKICVGVIADIQTNHVTDYERHALATLMAQQPDIILLPGDFFPGSAAEFETILPAYRELLSGLNAPGGVYAVLGNIDDREQVARLLAGTSIRLLADESVQVRVRDRLITVCGISYDRLLTATLPNVLRNFEVLPGQDDIRILLSHSPDSVLALPSKSRIDLTVAGHTHGGQVALPLFGPPITFSRLPRSVGAGGLHTINGHPIYVSRGVGCEGNQAPRVRFLCPPEISIINIE